MQWLISYELFNNTDHKSVRRSEIIDVEPAIWWNEEVWKDDQSDFENFQGCIITQIHEIPPEHETKEIPKFSLDLSGLDNYSIT